MILLMLASHIAALRVRLGVINDKLRDAKKYRAFCHRRMAQDASRMPWLRMKLEITRTTIKAHWLPKKTRTMFRLQRLLRMREKFVARCLNPIPACK